MSLDKIQQTETNTTTTKEITTKFPKLKTLTDSIHGKIDSIPNPQDRLSRITQILLQQAHAYLLLLSLILSAKPANAYDFKQSCDENNPEKCYFIRWRTNCVNCHINYSSTENIFTDDEIRKILLEVFQEWEKAEVLKINLIGDTNDTGSYNGTNDANTIAFIDKETFFNNNQEEQESSTESYAKTGITSTIGEILDADIRIRRDIFKNKTHEEALSLLKKILLHETGHALGLNHSTESNSIMQALIENLPNKIGPDDIAGLKELYKNSKGSSNICGGSGANFYDPNDQPDCTCSIKKTPSKKNNWPTTIATSIAAIWAFLRKRKNAQTTE